MQLDRVQASCDLMAGKHSQMLHVISKLRDISSKHAANEWSRVMGLISVRETMQAGLSRKHAQSLQQNVGAAKKRAGRGPIDPAVLQSAFDVVYHQVTSDSNGHERTCNETIADLALRQEGAQAGASAAHAQNVQLQQSRDKLLASLAVEQRVKKTDGAAANRYAGLVAQTAANFSMQNASHIENVARINQEITTSKQVLESIATIKTALKAYGYEAMMGMEKEEPPPPPAPGYSHDHVSDDILESGAGPQVIDSFGCNNSGGEHWCPTSQKCQRMWEEVCEPPRQVVGM